jgi:protein ImuB
LRLPVAMRDAKVFLKLLQLELAAHPPGAPVMKLWIAAEPARPRSAQRGLFLPITPEAEKLEVTLARISAVVGKRRSGIARLLDTHRKDGFRMERFVALQEEQKQETGKGPTVWDSRESPPVALRIFRPARKLHVQLVEGCPFTMTAFSEADRDEIQGKVLWSAGPWRSSGDWWAEQARDEVAAREEVLPWDREEWDVAVANRDSSSVALYRIYRDAGSGEWFADASYD